MTGIPTAGPPTLAGLRPARRADLRFSGPLRRGPAVVHLVRDPVAGRTFELGPKEHFVLARLDGEQTLGEVGDAYAQHFRSRLADPHWSRLLALFGTRRLLAGAPLPVAPAPDRPANRMLDGRIPLVADAPRLVDRLHRLLRPLLRPPALVVGGLAVVALLALLVADAGALRDATGEAVGQPGTLVALFFALQLSTAGHELAHGVVARRLGGTVSEFGLRWRLPMVYPYCTVEDIQFLPRRRQQVAVAVAGAAANLLFLLPVAVAWRLLPADAGIRPAVGALLVLGVAFAAANLLPFPPLDGYQILSYGLRTSRLAGASRTFLALALRRQDLSAYPPPLRRVYGGYGALVGLTAGAVVVGFVLVGHRVLADRWGSAAGVAPAAVLVALLALWAAGNYAKRRRSEVAA